MKRVLIVDDKEENLYFLQALLSGHGYTVVSARHGAEALVKARLAPPDLIISDLLMPVMDGYTLLRHWKADARLRRVPFVVYTATYTEPEDERLALALGADAFILKPAEPDEFLLRIQAVETGTRDHPPRPAPAPGSSEAAVLKLYSETLIRKLEEKTLLLEEANRTLQDDIAERKRAAEQIAEQATLLNQAGDAIIVCQRDHTIRYWNQGAERLYGWTAAEALGRPIGELIQSPLDQPSVQQILQQEGEWRGELQQRDKSGRDVVVASRLSLTRDEAGQPKSILAITTDVSERKRIEAQFLRAQRLESIGTLAGGVAHDLNNMLAPIVMGVSLLKASETDAEKLHLVDMIERSARRGTNLVKQVLSFARGVEGTRGPVKLHDLIQEFAAFASTTFPKQIAVKVEVPADVWPVLGDPTQLHQVLLNLGVNARDAMPSGGLLQITARNITVDAQYAVTRGVVTPGRYVVVTLSDTGTGMSPGVMEKIFDPFYSTKAQHEGTGLGLSTTHAILRSHGGFIDVRSTPGSGSTFEIFLPVGAAAIGRSTTPFDVRELPRGNGERVLVVDDESSILAITRQTLETFGYRVLTAEDGAQAIGLFALNRHDIAVVITDMMMPVMDGVGLAAALRRLDPQVRIIAASGLDAAVSPERLTQAGIHHFLAKPYSADTLLAVLKKALIA